jgi:anthranilate phosphoribosyltransferase
MGIQEAIGKLVTRHDLSAAEAEAVMMQIMDGAPTPAQIGAYLIALRAKGETIDEITGSVRAMRAKMLPIKSARSGLVDTCGTGGDKSGTFNISTTAAFVVAGAGAPVAKHGNRAATSQSGSADVLSALGINVTLTPEQVAVCIDEAGIGFAFAALHHPAMKNVAPIRRELGTRTIFNFLGPLSNPAGVKRQLIGVPDAALTEPLARALGDLGSEHVWVVHGPDGLDELSTTGVNRVSELKAGQVTTFELDPLAHGLARTTLDALGGGSPDFNATLTRSVLNNTATPERHDVVLLNAAAALVVAGVTADLTDGMRQARASIEAGAALRALEMLIAVSQRYAAG